MKKSIALFLSLVMLMSFIGTAWADDDAVNVVITDEGDRISVTIDGVPVETPPTGDTIAGVQMDTFENPENPASIKIGVNGSTYIENGSSVNAEATDDITSSGVGAIAIGETSVTFTADKNVNSVDDVKATGARVTAENGGSAAVTVGGDLSAAADNGYAYGAEMNAVDGGTAALTVEGLVTAEGNEAYGLDVHARGENASANMKIVEGISVTGESSVGASLTAADGGSVTLRVGDQEHTADVGGGDCGLVVSAAGNGENAAEKPNRSSAKSTDRKNGQDVDVDTAFQNKEPGDNVISVSGSVSGGIKGIQAESDNASVKMVILGDVAGGTTAIDADTDNGGEMTIDVYGDVNSGGTGIDAASKNGGELHVYAADYVSGERGPGVHVESEGMDSWTSVIVETGISSGTAAGIFAEGRNGGGANASAGGTVTGEIGILVDNDNGRVSIDVVNLDTGVTTNLEGTHNVAASEAGIEIRKSHAEQDGDTQTSVTIDGVLRVEDGGTPILLGDEVTETDVGTINITVWKIEGQGDGEIVSGGAEGAADALQSNIQYIIKIADDEESRMVFGDHYRDGDTLTEGVHEIMLTVPEGYIITAAYATDGTEVPIIRGEDGKYYASIPAGGGILLHASLTSIDGAFRPGMGTKAGFAYVSKTEMTAGTTGSFDIMVGGVRLADGKYMLILTNRERTMTFVRSTLERFAKLSDSFLIKTPNGAGEVSLSEILNYDEKAVNFRFDLTDEEVEIFSDGKLVKTIGPTEFI